MTAVQSSINSYPQSNSFSNDDVNRPVYGPEPVEGQIAKNPLANHPVLNDKANRSFYEHVVDLTKETSGIGSLYQALDKTLRVAALALKETKKHASKFCDRLAGKLLAVYSGLCLGRLLDVIPKAVSTVFSPERIHTNRGAADAVSTIADAGATIGYSAMFVAGNPAALVVAEGFSLAGTVSDLYVKGSDVLKANRLLGEVDESEENAPVKKMLKDTKMHTLLKIAKAVISLACTVLGAVWVSGASVVSAVVLLSLGLAGTVTGIAASLFKDSCTYKLLDFAEI
jgi:hypothetical protein